EDVTTATKQRSIALWPSSSRRVFVVLAIRHGIPDRVELLSMSTPSREQFVQQVLQVVAERFPLVKISRGEQPFSMKVNGHVASLENLYRAVALHPADEAQHQIERWIVELLRA